jgi:hypothetical protein
MPAVTDPQSQLAHATGFAPVSPCRNSRPSGKIVTVAPYDILKGQSETDKILHVPLFGSFFIHLPYRIPSVNPIEFENIRKKFL